MDWNTAAQGLFAFGWGCIAIWVARSIDRLSGDVNEMTKSISSLNTNVAVVIEKVSNHEKRIERLEEGN